MKRKATDKHKATERKFWSCFADEINQRISERAVFMMFSKKKGLRVVSIFLLVSLLLFFGGESVQDVCATETQTQGSDAYLKTLTASPGTMTPAFSPMVTSYTVTVPADVDKLNVTCSTADANATVTEAKGFKDLKMGNNSAVIKVKGSSGTICTYNITIIRGNMSEATNPAEGAGITLATNPPTTNTTTQTPIAQPTTDVSTDVSNTQETVNNDNSINDSETDTSQTDTSDVGTESETKVSESETTQTDTATDGVQAVPIMAELPASGDRYLIGGDSIYADYYVTSTFDTSLLPEGFVVEPYNFNGATVQSAYLAAGDIRVLYSESEEGSNGGLRIYYEDDKDVVDFVPFLGYSGYVFPVRYQAQIPVPLNYTGSYMPFDKKVVSCYIYTELTGNPLSVQEGMESEDTLQPGESAADADPVMVDTLDEMPEFYLFYGMNNNGEENFYLYDWKEGTYQRYVERDTSYDLDQSYFKYKDMSHQRFVIMCILFVLLLLAIFVIVNLYMKNRELKRDLEDYDPDYRGEDDDSDSYDKDDDTDNEDDDDDDDDDDSDSYDTDQDDSDFDNLEDDFYQNDEKTDEENDIGVNNDLKQKIDDMDDDLIKEQYPIHVSPEMFEDDGKMQESAQTDSTDGLSDSLTDYLDVSGASGVSSISTEGENVTPKEATGSFRRPEFKMINLSREPEPSGIDDDFEFEFIHFEDD